jgi:hypothetical protein
MTGLQNVQVDNIWIIIGIVLGVSLLITLVLAVWVISSIRRINLPPNADFITAIKMTPLSVVILLDLLDFTFDFLSAPIAWAILGYLGLRPLRGVTVIESLIPFTQTIPTMTIAWVVVRLLKLDSRTLPQSVRDIAGRIDDRSQR